MLILVAIAVLFRFDSLLAENICSICKCKSEFLDCSKSNFAALPKINNASIISHLSFANNFLHSVPQLPKLSVKQLSFSKNEIVKIQDSAFKYLTELSALDLSNNFLTTDKFLPGIFRGSLAVDKYEPLEKLRHLDVSYNNLHSLHPYVFEHIPFLEVLILKGNPLKVTSHGILMAFSYLLSLKELNLSETGLKQLSDNLFHTQKHIEILDLSFNQFSEPPTELEYSHQLRWLSLDSNLFTQLRKFPRLPHLEILHLSQMPKMISIENRSLSGLPRLKEFYCYNNPKFVTIEKTAFSSTYGNKDKRELWPHLNVVVLRNNSLQQIDAHLIGRWDYLNVIDLQHNPWLCDCENQWLVSVLAPMIREKQPELLTNFKCGKPSEMENLSILYLYQQKYEMRCLDTYSHKPEKDGKLLLEIFVLVIISSPVIMGTLLLLKYLKSDQSKSIMKKNHHYSQINLIETT